jgi:hypothetical protein
MFKKAFNYTLPAPGAPETALLPEPAAATSDEAKHTLCGTLSL